MAEPDPDPEQLMYTAAHDLKAPLRSIQGFTQILMARHKADLKPEAQALLQRVVDAGTRMEWIIESALAYSRVGRQALDVETVPLEDAVDTSVRGLAAKLKNRGGAVSVKKPLPSVKGDAGLVTRAVGELISNAVTYVAPDKKPEASVSAETRPDGRVRLWVQDNGLGIEERDRERIFKPYERLHGPQEYGGAGMGLAIARRCARRLDGEVGLEDGASGGGSRFWLELPAA